MIRRTADRTTRRIEAEIPRTLGQRPGMLVGQLAEFVQTLPQTARVVCMEMDEHTLSIEVEAP